MLKKLALVSAISMISAGAFAMEAMDDESMAATTGQDGITINVIPDTIVKGATGVANTLKGMGVTDATINKINPTGYGFKGLSIGEIRVHDDDGLGASTLTGTGTGNSGALVIGGVAVAEDLNGDGDMLDAGELAGDATRTEANRTVVFAKGDKPIQLNIDMVGDSNGSAANGGAMLNLEIKLPTTAIKLGDIYVANSNAAAADRDADGLTSSGSAEVDGTDITAGSKVKILSGLEVVMGESNMNIQLGNEAQGHMIVANATLVGGLTINNFELFDEFGTTVNLDTALLKNGVTSGGSIRAKSISILNNTVTGANGTDLTANAAIDVGSRVTTTTLTAGAIDQYIGGVAAQTAAASINVDTAYNSVNLITTNAPGGGPISADISATSSYSDVTTAIANLGTALTNSRDAGANAASGGAFPTYAAAVAAQSSPVPATAAAATAVVNGVDADPSIVGIQNVITAVTNLQGLVDTKVAISNDVSLRPATWGGVDTYNGLVITTTQLGHATYGANVSISNLALGDANAVDMGDIQIIGLRMGTDSKIVIMGH